MDFKFRVDFTNTNGQNLLLQLGREHLWVEFLIFAFSDTRWYKTVIRSDLRVEAQSRCVRAAAAVRCITQKGCLARSWTKDGVNLCITFIALLFRP